MFIAILNKEIHLVLCNIRLLIKWRSKKVKGQGIEREMTVERVVAVSCPQPTKGLGEHRKLPQRIWDEASAANDFWTFYT